MATIPTLIACRSDPFTPAVTCDTFDLAGAWLDNKAYTSAVPGTTDLECPIQLADRTFLLSASLIQVVKLGPSLVFTSASLLTIPASITPYQSSPQLYPNIPSAATAIVGFWQNGQTPNETVLESIHPTTLAQTTLWANFQANPNDVIAGCGLSRDGLTWYYRDGATSNILALDLATGVSTTFITAPSGGFPTSTGTYTLSELPDGTFIVLWTIGGTALRLLQYDAAGSPSGIDIALSDLGNAGVFAIEPDGGAVWVLGAPPSGPPYNPVLQRYLIPGGTLDVDTTVPDADAYYVDLLVADVATAAPVPIRTPLAPQTPCEPQSEVTNGGIGHSGCNTGGVGWTSMYEGPYGAVPQHDDPIDGEALAGKRGIDVWLELVHTEYPAASPATTTYRRSFVELADLPSYEGGRKPAGLKAIGDIEHGLSNEQGGFEAATVDLEYADQTDRLFRGLLETQDLEQDEVRVKAASPQARVNGDAPRVLSRAVVQRAGLSAPLSARITAVDELFADFGPFGPNRTFPGVTFGDLGDAMPDAPADTKAQVIPVLYGEKSDHGAVPVSRGLLPGYYCGRFDLTGSGIDVAPDSDGTTLEAVVAALQASVDALTLAADFPGIGVDDAAVLQAMGTVPSDFSRLARIIGEQDLLDLMAAGTTPAPDDTAWGFIAFGLGTWFRFLEVYGSNLSGGDPTAKQDRVLLDLSTRSDILVPGFIWPFATPYVEFTNPDTGDVYWLTGIWVRGPILDDHLHGVINLTANAIGNEDVGDGSGLPIVDAHLAQQHWIENYLIGNYTSGLWATDGTYPAWEDGVPKVRSSSFTTRQAFTATSLGGRGLTVGWYANTARGLSAWFSEWNASTESRLGFNGHGQVMVWGLDETVDPTDWPRIDHVVDVFGPIKWTSGEERENVVTGSCDWDPDAQKYRIGPITQTSLSGIAIYKGHRKPGTPITSTILNIEAHLVWVLARRLARLRVGTKLFDVPGKMDLLDYDVGTGFRFSSIEGPAAVTMVHRPVICLRRRFNFATRITTMTLWDLDGVLTTVGDEDLEGPMVGDEESVPPTAVEVG